MYTVKQVAALTGVTEATLRAWERRYAVVQPARTAGGYRLYDDDMLSVLREVSSLVKSRVPASRAVATVLERPPSQVSTFDPALSGDDLEQAARSLDPRWLDAVISTAFSGACFEQVVSQWLQPQLQRLGRAWEEGRLTIDQEHFASAGLMRALSVRFEQAPRPDPSEAAPAVIVGLPAGERHELALLAFATCLRLRGLDVIHLGADVPVDAWVHAARTSRGRAAVLGVPSTADLTEAQRVIDRLGELTPPVTVWTGGSQAEQVLGAVPLPQDLAAAAVRFHLGLVSGLSIEDDVRSSH